MSSISTQSTDNTIADALQTDLKSLVGVGSGLNWEIELSQFFIQKVPRLPSTGIDRARLIIAPVDELNTVATIASNDVFYSYGIIIVRPGNANADMTVANADLDRLHLWRETIRRAYTSSGRLTSVGVRETLFEPRAKLDIAAFRKLYDVTAFTIRARKRELGT